MSIAEVAWQPTSEMIESANLTRFIAACGRRDYDDLLVWSISDPEPFYRRLFDFVDYRFTQPFTKAMDATRGLERTRWCVGGRTNVALNCLDKWAGTATAAD